MKLRLRNLLTVYTQSRRLLRTLDRIAAAQEQQTRILQRLADHFLPAYVEPTPEELQRTTEITFSRDREQAEILLFAEKIRRDLGREPSEEEILDHLLESAERG